jgi:hypothetical protein
MNAQELESPVIFLVTFSVTRKSNSVSERSVRRNGPMKMALLFFVVAAFED